MFNVEIILEVINLILISWCMIRFMTPTVMLASIEIKTWIIDDVTTDLNGMYVSINRLQTHNCMRYALLHSDEA